MRAEDAPRCAQCGDVIGVYERIVFVVNGRACASSRAAEPGGCCTGEACFHLGCYPRPLVVPVD